MTEDEVKELVRIGQSMWNKFQINEKMKYHCDSFALGFAQGIFAARKILEDKENLQTAIKKVLNSVVK